MTGGYRSSAWRDDEEQVLVHEEGGLAKTCEMRMQRTGDVVGSRLDRDVGLVVGV